MGKSINSLVPKDIFEEAKNISRIGNLKHNIDGFKVINGISPQIISIKKIRQPKSKNVFLQIDTRHILRL